MLAVCPQTRPPRGSSALPYLRSAQLSADFLPCLPSRSSTDAALRHTTALARRGSPREMAVDKTKPSRKPTPLSIWVREAQDVSR